MARQREPGDTQVQARDAEQQLWRRRSRSCRSVGERQRISAALGFGDHAFVAGAESSCERRRAGGAGNPLDAALEHLVANRTDGREDCVGGGLDAVSESAAVPLDAGGRGARVKAQRAAAFESELRAQVSVERVARVVIDVGVLVDVRECDFVTSSKVRRGPHDEHVANEAAHGRANAAMVHARDEQPDAAGVRAILGVFAALVGAAVFDLACGAHSMATDELAVRR